MSEHSDDKKVHWLNLRYTEQQCPGMREILAMAPKDQQSALARGILYQWCLVHQQQGTLMQAMTAALNGPGVKGERGLRRPRKGVAKTAPAVPQADSTQATPPPAPVVAPQQTPPVATPIQVAPPPPAPEAAAVPPATLPAQQAAPPPAPADEQPLAADTAASALFDMFDDD